MMMKNTNCIIQKLPKSVLNHLQSQITISSFEAAIRELMQNSLDANADEIRIKLDFRTLSVCIEDNGRGMTPEELENAGKRYFTSKLDLLDNLKNTKTFGFRGEGLHSIGCISHLSLISKHISNKQTFKLKNINGVQQACVYNFKDEHTNHLERHFNLVPILRNGTIVTATNLFVNVPVRRNQILKLPERKLLEDVKRAILQSLVGGPNVRLTLFKVDLTLDSLDQIILIEKNKENELHTRYATIFKSIYGSSLLSEYETIRAVFQDYKLEGIIGLFPSQSKTFQHIFINGRPILISNEDSNYLNKIFIAANFGSGIQVSNASEKSYQSATRVCPSKQFTSKSFSRFPVFIIDVQCPVTIEDLLQDPSKSIYYSNHLKFIINMVRNVFSSFLRAQRYSIIRGSLVSPNPSSKRQRGILSPSKPCQLSTIPKRSPFLERNVSNSNNESSLECGEIRVSNLPLRQLAYLRTNSLSANESIPQSKCDADYDSFTTEGVKNRNENSDYYDIFNDTLINKNDLINGNYRIIKQIDRKFIMIIMPTTNITSQAKTPTLLMIDQHACDERIRVEVLLKDFIFLSLDQPLDIELKESFTLHISNRESDLFKSYRSTFISIGIIYVTSTDYELTVTHLPRILIEKVGNDDQFLKSCLLQHLFDLEGHIKKSDISNVSSKDWARHIVNLPQILIEIINSKACRSAIMFGHELTFAEMVYLLKLLSKCNQPFQCAHGRPSIVPFVSLSK